ncbi:uncharacterized protein LOC114529965 [Dendronephthya gigantea]|uniref:uncharacterized protein LOC114529965 n=1 Tax=Dendronephthya gigantea TaxID=151771 RepID=UPI00106C3AF7|nr:uncharacterized protein LOC114529965 [Dendronephthya gigantea]XP_028407339.1 uncharacterized protein LOC114529965 [Dendronephthya gigantea]
MFRSRPDTWRERLLRGCEGRKRLLRQQYMQPRWNLRQFVADLFILTWLWMTSISRKCPVVFNTWDVLTIVIKELALPDLVANLWDKIDWYDMQKTVREYACVAYDKGYKYFAVQFYGECWGARSMIEYDKYGASNDCWSGVGKDFTNYVYKFTK